MQRETLDHVAARQDQNRRATICGFQSGRPMPTPPDGHRRAGREAMRAALRSVDYEPEDWYDDEAGDGFAWGDSDER